MKFLQFVLVVICAFLFCFASDSKAQPAANHISPVTILQMRDHRTASHSECYSTIIQYRDARVSSCNAILEARTARCAQVIQPVQNAQVTQAHITVEAKPVESKLADKVIADSPPQPMPAVAPIAAPASTSNRLVNVQVPVGRNRYQVQTWEVDANGNFVKMHSGCSGEPCPLVSYNPF